MWRPWVREEMLNYALHTLIRMISKRDCREMSSKIINVSQNVNNYNNETWNTKNALKKIIFIRNITTLSLSSTPLLYLSYKLQKLKKCHALSNCIIRENCGRCMIFFFFLPSIADEWPRKEKSGNMTANVLYVLDSLWNFGTPHQDLCIIFIVWVLPSFSNTWLPSSSQLSHELCYFLHLSVSHCFITDVSSVSCLLLYRFHNQERQGNFFFKEEF